MKHIKDILVKTGSYTDRSGNDKSRYEKVGRVLQMDDGREMFLLNRTFNPAGVQTDKDSIILSIFDVKDEKREVPTEAKAGIQKLNQSVLDADSEIPF